MNWLDYLLLAILAWSTFRSFRKGFSREVIGLAAAGAALVLGMWFYGLAGSYVAPWVASPRAASLCGFFLIVFGVLLCGALVGHLVGRLIRTAGLSFFDRAMGAFFGLLRGLVVAVSLLTAFIAFGPRPDRESAPAAVLHSQIAPWVLEASRIVVAIAPMDLKQSFREQYSRIRSELEKPTRT